MDLLGRWAKMHLDLALLFTAGDSSFPGQSVFYVSSCGLTIVLFRHKQEKIHHADTLCNLQLNNYLARALVSCRFHICFVLLFRCSKECAKPVPAHLLSWQSDKGRKREGRIEDAIAVAKPGQMVIHLGIPNRKPATPWG